MPSTDDLLDDLMRALSEINLLLTEQGRPRVAELVFKDDGMLSIGCAPGTTCTVQTPYGAVVVRDQAKRHYGGYRFA